MPPHDSAPGWTRGCDRARRVAVLAALSLTLLAGGTFPGPAQAEEELNDARAMAQAGDHAGALEQLDAWLAEHPDDRDACFLRAQVLAWSGAYDASRRAYDELLAADPGSADYLLGRAQAWLWSGQSEHALEDIRAARAIAPDYAALADLERQALESVAAPKAGEPATAPPRVREVIAQASWEDLDRGYDDWVNASVSGRTGILPNTEARGSAAYVGRYGKSDVEASLGASWFSARGFEVGVDFGGSANGNFLPEWSVQAYALARLPAATTLQAGYRHARYSSTRNDTLSLTAEKYFSRTRLAYSLYRGDPADAEAAYSHAFRFDVYYGEASWVGAQYTTGDETESDGAGGLLVTAIEGAGLIGRHQLAPGWAVVWALAWHDQGDLYRRVGFNVGVARRF